MTAPIPSRDRLRGMLDYNQETGVLIWRSRRERSNQWNGRYAGSPAFTANADGYKTGRVDGIKFQAHRVIWKWLNDEEPPQIDHINGVRSDNRAVNLRASGPAENRKNISLARNNTSGVCGVSWDKSSRKWRAFIGYNRKLHEIGLFSSLEEAASARIERQRALGFSERHGCQTR